MSVVISDDTKVDFSNLGIHYQSFFVSKVVNTTAVLKLARPFLPHT